MATTVQIIDDIADWLNENCKDIKLKKPINKNDEYKLASPTAFSQFLATENVNYIDYPFILVQFNNCDEQLINHTGDFTVLLHIGVWNPGTHPNEGKNIEVGVMKYARNADGWRDAFTLADFIIDKIKQAGNIKGHNIIYSNGIKSYPYKEQNTIVDFYPYYFAEVEFTVEKTFALTPKPYDNFL